jgi:hypothetical protein
MSEDEPFFSRWSRRKLASDRASAATQSPEKRTETPGLCPDPAPEAEVAEEALAIPLPDIESLLPGTDMTPFFQKGVTEQVRNAALRRLWSIDSAIRDYVDPALDYAYDWNTPGGAPGYGPITAHDLMKLADEQAGATDGPASSIPPGSGPVALPQEEPATAVCAQQERAENPSPADDMASIAAGAEHESPVTVRLSLPAEANSGAALPDVEPDRHSTTLTDVAARRHGGALPQ